MHVRIQPGPVAARHSYIAHDALRAAAEEKGSSPSASTPPPPPGSGERAANLRAAVLTMLTADAYGNAVTTGYAT